ncbi:MAG: adenylate/guanylate cyclase domain-containing protein [Rhodopirellula sp.]|nr:adenylate/guanylate cyclase domain-containing protein [Rhodopirellula sp.]
MTVELQARGTDDSQCSVRSLDTDDVFRIGRSPQNDWVVNWDRLISREHAQMRWHEGKLQVRCYDKATNPIIINGESFRELKIDVGGEFLIGATKFRLVSSEDAEPADSSDMDMSEDEPLAGLQTYQSDELNEFQFSDPIRQMDMLARLPKMISGSTSDEALAGLLVDVLLETIPAGVATAVMRYEGDLSQSLVNPLASGFDPSKPAMMRVATRDDYEGRFKPSRRMISSALQTGNSVLHIWDGDEGNGQFTVSGSLDWAFCTPIMADKEGGWCLYVSGQGSENSGVFIDEDTLKGDLRFVELVAQFIGSIRHVRLLEEQKTQLSSFFSPRIMDSLLDKNSTSLEPSQQDISVLFCDVRGFSRKSELLKDDLFQLLATIKRALGLMANGIVESDGAIADFQGDAALGFWGWPMPLPEGPVPACRAALSIVDAFNNKLNCDGMLDGFSVGIGIAHGQAIAGEIGTEKQAKIGVFGPVVNQGSRYEGLTKQFGVPICIDETTADYVEQFMPKDEARVRRMARVRPAGMQTPLTVYQLLPALRHDPSVSDEMIARYEEGINAVLDGKWSDAVELLSEFRETDGPTRFVLSQMELTNFEPPAGWDGAFTLTKK